MNKELTFALGSMILAIVLLFGTAFDSEQVSSQSGGGNVSVRLNVTNTAPRVLTVYVYDGGSPFTDADVDLSANSAKQVICNATVSDTNGGGDIINATARFYSIVNSGFAGGADNNHHYRNDSCIETYDIAGTANNRSVVCRFSVQYYANNETWECNINVSDNGGTQIPESKFYFSDNKSDQVMINSLLAMTVPIQDVDFGNLSATETSSVKTINVTNAGNIPTNFTVRGFGGNGTGVTQAETLYPNVSMMCETGNITIGNLRYSNSSGAAWSDMINTTPNATLFGNTTLMQRTNDNAPTFGQDLNLTFWRIRVPTGVAGLCNGTVAFQATNAAS